MPRMSAEEPKDTVVIRDIVDLAEMRELEELQKDIWRVEDREVFPALAFRPITAVGGVLMGAFVTGRMAGFVFGFPGLENNQVILHSDMLGVRSEYRSHGIGYKLKLAQRERALEKGIDRITWTFDPLQFVNAHLNFSRLGVISDRYLVNFYGETTSFLHSTGTDRLWLTWLLNSERVKRRLAKPATATRSSELDRASVLVRVAQNEEPITNTDVSLSGSAVIEIPQDINSLPSDLKLRWREATRQAFTKALDSGYVVEEFSRMQREGRNTGSYLLRAREDRSTNFLVP
jgi:predicted GNAT superfamily acetyltransferase